MEDKPHPHSKPTNAPTCSDKSCTTASCGGPGLCPGIALFIAWGAGIGIATLTGIAWLGWAVGILLALILITGAWRWLPGRAVNKTT